MIVRHLAVLFLMVGFWIFPGDVFADLYSDFVRERSTIGFSGEIIVDEGQGFLFQLPKDWVLVDGDESGVVRFVDWGDEMSVYVLKQKGVAPSAQIWVTLTEADRLSQEELAQLPEDFSYINKVKGELGNRFRQVDPNSSFVLKEFYFDEKANSIVTQGEVNLFGENWIYLGNTKFFNSLLVNSYLISPDGDFHKPDGSSTVYFSVLDSFAFEKNKPDWAWLFDGVSSQLLVTLVAGGFGGVILILLRKRGRN